MVQGLPKFRVSIEDCEGEVNFISLPEYFFLTEHRFEHAYEVWDVYSLSMSTRKLLESGVRVVYNNPDVTWWRPLTPSLSGLAATVMQPQEGAWFQ